MKKQHGFVPNLKQKQFVIPRMLKAREIFENLSPYPLQMTVQHW